MTLRRPALRRLRATPQQLLYHHNHTIPDLAAYAQLLALESRWPRAEADALEAEAPPFSDLRELLAALDDRLRAEEAAPSDSERFIAEQATRAQFAHIAGQFAVDGLVESQSHLGILPRLPRRARMAVMRVLIDEFGCGNEAREHAGLYARLMVELGLSTDPFEHAAHACEETLAYVNLFHWLASRAPTPDYFLGAYAYFESSVLYGFRCYAAACERLGIEAGQYYTEHLHIDSFHSRDMIAALRAWDHEHGADLAKVWAGVELTRATVARATEAAVLAARTASAEEARTEAST
ncbi:iron-containing redox enzyme family protein [Streptomyces ossamyceticus]|uniref:iron-containing redox enzyme family protein n=1 Tax=Streptomyces ossamyceticus TaxID=249581 RepID=UPI0006E2A1BD|nr:iron-containing redox enzyme family protein [Streptomyces ossamyceticus]